MKIKITEGQLQRLMLHESFDDIVDSDSTLKEYPGSEVSYTSNLSNSDGDLEHGDPKILDKFSDELPPQNYWLTGRPGHRLPHGGR